MALPWFVKIAAKIVLSRLPIRYALWRNLNLFRAGGMDDPKTAHRVFHMHSDAAGFAGRTGHCVLELGPGDSMLTALFARSAGAACSILVDQSPLATTQMKLYRAAEAMLVQKGLPATGVSGAKSVTEIQTLLNCSYLVGGLDSLRAIPDESVDLVFSNAVIEHVRRRNFAQTAQELWRVMKPDGVASHWIDYRDHLQNGLNNLRFSEAVWESKFMANSGFYTNRMTAAEIRGEFEAVGFVVETRDTQLWPGGLPTPRQAMSPPFDGLTDEQLMVMTNWLLLRKRRERV